MLMTWDEWTDIVGKLNANYPDQPINPATASEWWTELQAFSAGDVWLAIRHHIRNRQPDQHGRPRGSWRPTLTDILNGIDAVARQLGEQRRSQQRAAGELQARRRSGVPAPPEFREAVAIHREASRPDTRPEDRAKAAQMIDALADQLEQRATRPAETARDATRTCAECASSPSAGFVETWQGGLTPCPGCNAARRAAWRSGRLADRTEPSGLPSGMSGSGAA